MTLPHAGHGFAPLNGHETISVGEQGLWIQSSDIHATAATLRRIIEEMEASAERMCGYPIDTTRVRPSLSQGSADSARAPIPPAEPA